MSPPPDKHTPARSGGMRSPGSSTTTSAPASRSTRRYRSRAARFRGVLAAETVRAMRGRVIASMLARELDELDEHAPRRARMQERDAPLDTPSRVLVDELDAVARQPSQRAGEVRHLEAEVMHRRAAALREEPRDAGLRVRRLEQLHPRSVARREDHADALVGHAVLGPDGVAEDIAIEGSGLAERRHRDADVVERSGRDPGHAARGSNTPKTPRRSSQISPSVTPARTAAMIGGTRFALPFAAATSSPRAAAARPASRAARARRTRSAWPRAVAS